jgi:hypothetical protein
MIWRALWPMLLAAALALISANFLLGLPGAFFIDALLEPGRVAAIGPGAMGVAITVSMLAPFGIAPAIWAMLAWRPQSPWWQWAGACLGGYLIGGALATYNIA